MLKFCFLFCFMRVKTLIIRTSIGACSYCVNRGEVTLLYFSLYPAIWTGSWFCWFVNKRFSRALKHLWNAFDQTTIKSFFKTFPSRKQVVTENQTSIRATRQVLVCRPRDWLLRNFYCSHYRFIIIEGKDFHRMPFECASFCSFQC